MKYTEPRIIRISSAQVKGEKIEEAARLIKGGGIVAFPTDTVYGLGVDAQNKRAVGRLYQVKSRSREKPLILFIAKKEEVFHFARTISPRAQRLIRKFWPGPLTLILKASPSCPSSLVSKQGEVGMRLPAHPVPQEMIKKGELLLATTSANISGEKSPLRVDEISKSLRKKVDLLIDGGEIPLGRDSTVVDVTSSSPQLIRKGWISWERIRKIWDKEEDILFVCTGNSCRSPMAEGFLRQASREGKGEIKIHSAGTNTLPGLRATEFAIKVMKEQNIDISNHLSAPLTREMVEEADLILVMERRHRERICEICPSVREKVFLLKEFGLGRVEEIPDPIGGSLESYRKCALEIKKSVEGVMKKLKGGYNEGGTSRLG